MTLSDRIGREGQPYEMESIPDGLLKAKVGEPGHDDKLNKETQRRRHRNRFEQYGYKRLTKRQIAAFEFFALCTELMQTGLISQQRYDGGSIKSANHGERTPSTRAMQAARIRRQCMRLIWRKASSDSLSALLIAVEADKTPQEIAATLLIRKARWRQRDPNERPFLLDPKAKAALALVWLRDALDVVSDYVEGRSKVDIT